MQSGVTLRSVAAQTGPGSKQAYLDAITGLAGEDLDGIRAANPDLDKYFGQIEGEARVEERYESLATVRSPAEEVKEYWRAPDKSEDANMPAAVFAYNHDSRYVAKVLSLAATYS